MRKSVFLMILVFATFQLAHAQNFVGKQKHIDQILVNISAFSAHVVNADVDALSKAYTSDAKIFPDNRDIIAGREPIGRYWTMPEGVEIIHHKIFPEEIIVKGKIAYDHGYYEGKTKLADGTTSSWKGKYVIVWKRIGKEWQIYLDIWNRVPNDNG